MQGSYKNNGLPRPYYMKPNKRGSAYDHATRLVFLTNSRKLMGYIVMLALFGLCMFMVSQELKPKPDALFEIMDPLEVKTTKNNGDVGNLVDSDKKEYFEQPQVANNKAQNSRGEYGHGVMEAPKGGMVNEGPVVGADEGLLVDGKTKKTSAEVEVKVADDGAPVAVARGNGVKASRESEEKAAAEPQNPDLRKLNEKNSKPDAPAKARDIVAPRKGDVDIVDPDDKIVDEQTKAEVDIRMHKKVDAMARVGDEDTIKKGASVDEPKKNNNGKASEKNLVDDEVPVAKKEEIKEKDIDIAVKKGLKLDNVRKEIADADTI